MNMESSCCYCTELSHTYCYTACSVIDRIILQISKCIYITKLSISENSTSMLLPNMLLPSTSFANRIPYFGTMNGNMILIHYKSSILGLFLVLFYHILDGMVYTWPLPKCGYTIDSSQGRTLCRIFWKIGMQLAKFKPLHWFIYLDDTIIIWSESKELLTNFLDHLNSIHMANAIYHGSFLDVNKLKK